MSETKPGGFRRKRKIYHIEFDDYPGLYIKARSINTGEFMDVSDMRETVDKDPAAMRKMFEFFAAQIVEWNLEDEDGTPFPPTLESLLDQEFDFVQDLVKGWMDAIAGVSAPLAANSPDGASQTMASIPMEPLSASQAS